MTTLDVDLGGGAVITGVVSGIEGAAVTFSAAVRGEIEITKLDMATFASLQTKVAGGRPQ